MNNINSLELKRKIFHILIGIVCIILLVYEIITPLFIFIWLIIGLFVSLLSVKFKIPIISWFLNHLERDKKTIMLPGRGIIFAFAGCLLVLKLFPINIALASITILTFADPISHLTGKIIGKTKTLIDNRKNIEGPIIGAIISCLFAMFFIPFYMAFPAALSAMIFELLIIKIQDIELDDNLVIPLIAGTTMFLIQIII